MFNSTGCYIATAKAAKMTGVDVKLIRKNMMRTRRNMAAIEVTPELKTAVDYLKTTLDTMPHPNYDRALEIAAEVNEIPAARIEAALYGQVDPDLKKALNMAHAIYKAMATPRAAQA